MSERKAGSSVGSHELLGLVFGDGSFRCWDEEAGPLPAFADTERYRAELAAARARAGVDEAVVTGEGRIGGRRVAVACGEFAFLAGSIGVASARRLVAAIERATRERLPMLAVTASGGTRMQEGAPAFLRMAGIAAAVAEHKRAGLPYLVYLRHPTTGGVLASWGSLGHVTLAEPGALIGFLGPKVYLALHGRPFPDGVQTAENLHAHGLVDAVLPPEQLAGTVGRILDLLDPSAPAKAEADAARPGAEGRDGTSDGVTAWTSITRSRDERRPGVWELLGAEGVDALPLAGATGPGDGHGLLLAVARIGGTHCVLVGQDRRAQATRPLGPDALRLARRGMQLAAELGLPLVTVIDTPGAALSVPAEEGGLAGEIAHCLAELVTLPVPTVSVLLGQGAGGAALALLPADRVIAARHGWLAPLPPEGASAIVHHRPDRAAEVAAAQRVTSADLLRDGAVDTLVDEHPDAAEEPAAFVRRLATEVATAVRDLATSAAEHRLAARRRRYRDYPGKTPRTPF
ncbi:carboxyl transferase domain-containing protein [Pseudonocardia acaciae]|uniref:carboxyl transferase domain-containing protein n=1 Tax=Pseudonocardia acaciae TaxID=551276 RepID=UPI00056A932C|nr:carboxyl transferase domain-containing protein [Pseudonocardia acaciae]